MKKSQKILVFSSRSEIAYPQTQKNTPNMVSLIMLACMPDMWKNPF